MPDAVSREREVWPKAEARLLDRAMTLLAAREIKLQLACTRPGCAPLAKVRNDDGSITLQCGHKDRVFMRAF